MSHPATQIYHDLATNQPIAKLCGQCPAFTARQVGPLTTGHVVTACGVTGVHVSSRRAQCNLTDKQKRTWAPIAST